MPNINKSFSVHHPDPSRSLKLFQDAEVLTLLIYILERTEALSWKQNSALCLCICFGGWREKTDGEYYLLGFEAFFGLWLAGFTWN